MVDPTTQQLRDSGRINSYAAHLNILCRPLQAFDLLRLAAKVKDQWFTQSLCEVNSNIVRMGLLQGVYHWQKDNTDDRFFFCVDGELTIELPDKSVVLQPLQGVVVPKGTPYRQSAIDKSLVLMIEQTNILTELKGTSTED